LWYSIAVTDDRRRLMTQIIVEVGKQRDGATFQLSPRTRLLLGDLAPNGFLASSVFLAFDIRKAFSDPQAPWWEHVVLLLTGLSSEQLRRLGGFRFVDPSDSEVLYEYHAA
jgi:hypothetical protein